VCRQGPERRGPCRPCGLCRIFTDTHLSLNHTPRRSSMDSRCPVADRPPRRPRARRARRAAVRSVRAFARCLWPGGRFSVVTPDRRTGWSQDRAARSQLEGGDAPAVEDYEPVAVPASQYPPSCARVELLRGSPRRDHVPRRCPGPIGTGPRHRSLRAVSRGSPGTGVRTNAPWPEGRILILKRARAVSRRFLPGSPFNALPEEPPVEQFAVRDQVNHDK
jgi:hypothetical protein